MTLSKQTPISLLAIDTSDRCAHVALYRDGHTIVRSASDRKSVERLPELIHECCEELDASLDGLDGVGVSLGPGSFTGTRAGIAYAIGLQAALSIELVAVSALLARAHLVFQQDAEADSPNTRVLSLRASKTEYFYADCSYDGRITIPLSATRCGLSLEKAIPLDDVQPAESIIRYILDLKSKFQVKGDNRWYSHLNIQKPGELGTSGLEPIYVKSPAAKTLSERGL